MSNGVNLLTGHKATNHISAADDAAFAAALLTSENCVVADEQEVTLTVDTNAGTLTVGSFVALFSGRKVICDGADATYTKPASGTTYRHVSAGILYTKDTSDDDVEDCEFVVYTSAEDRTAESTAADDDTGAPETTVIGSATTEAYMELFDLIVSASAVKSKNDVYALAHTMPGIETSALFARVKQYTGEKTATEVGAIYFTFSESAYQILRSSRVALITLWNSDGFGSKTAWCIWSSENNLDTVKITIPMQVEISTNNWKTVSYRIYADRTESHNGQLAVAPWTSNSDGTYVVTPANMPFTHATIYSWR